MTILVSIKCSDFRTLPAFSELLKYNNLVTLKKLFCYRRITMLIANTMLTCSLALRLLIVIKCQRDDIVV